MIVWPSFSLRREVARILGLRRDLDRDLLDDGETEAVESGELARVVGQDANRRQAEVGEYLVADPPLPRVRRKAELEVRLDGVEPGLLQLVRPELVEQPYPATLLPHVEEDAAALRVDPRESLLELLTAIAQERVEHVAGQALEWTRTRTSSAPRPRP